MSSKNLWLQQLVGPDGVLMWAGGLSQDQQEQLLMAALNE